MNLIDNRKKDPLLFWVSICLGVRAIYRLWAMGSENA